MVTHYPLSYPIRSSASGQSIGSCGTISSSSSFGTQHESFSFIGNESLELNEASEPSLHDKTGKNCLKN